MRLRTNQFYFAIAFLVSLCAPAVSARGLSTAGDYANRLERAEQAVNEAIEQDSPAFELAPRIKRLLPASEEVELNEIRKSVV